MGFLAKNRYHSAKFELSGLKTVIEVIEMTQIADSKSPAGSFSGFYSPIMDRTDQKRRWESLKS
jgi:hypothetical protein